jgi:hypothetical protein
MDKLRWSHFPVSTSHSQAILTALVNNTSLGATVSESYEQLLILFNEHDGYFYYQIPLSGNFCYGFGVGSAHGALSTFHIIQTIKTDQ